MADGNTGLPRRWENGGALVIGALNIVNIKMGTLKHTIGGREHVQNMDRGKLTGVTLGNERASTVELELQYTSPLTANAVLTSILGTIDATSKKYPFKTAGNLAIQNDVIIQVPDVDGGTTGDKYTYTGAYIADPADISVAAGAEVDTLKVKWQVPHASPKVESY